jgi:lysophospholipase L1-like esterase
MKSYGVVLTLAIAALNCPKAAAAESLRYSFGEQALENFTTVNAETRFDASRGFGFEPGTKIEPARSANASSLTRGVTAGRPFLFTSRLPHEGNWRVTVTVGHPAAPSTTTIKAELRRLMIEAIASQRGETQRVTFVVNTRTPRIAAIDGIAAGEVRLKAPRETVQEAWAWDQALTLEFSGENPTVQTIEIEPVDVPTLFILGDSTVCDQSKEPYNSWGQMITRWFKPTLAVANHGESGETYRDSIARRRLDKIASTMRPGDWLLMQFGHNDQKQIASGTGGPFTTYKDETRRHVTVVRARGGNVVVISPMERRGFDEQGEVKPSLGDYAKAAGEVAQEMGVPFIDLNTLSRKLYVALGVERSALAFATLNGKVDNTHHNNFGSYELAKCIAVEIRQLALPLAKHLRDDLPTFNPSQPDDPAALKLPASGQFTNQRPLGDETNH